VGFLRERFWIVKLTGLAIVAALAGSAAMTAAGMWLLDVEPVPRPEVEEPAEVEPPPAKSAPALAAGKPRAMEAILARNVFCPTCAPESTATPPAAMADAPVSTGAPPPLRLVATMESTDPGASLATVYNTVTRTSGVFTTGDTIIPGIRLLDVRGGTVSVSHGGGTVLLRVGQEPAPVAAPPTPPPKTTPKKPATPKSSLPGAAEAIECGTDHVCNVEREFVESLLGNPAALAGQAAVRPTANGFAFTRVRAGTLPHLLGLRTGDVVTEVNGEALDSLDKAIALATKLRHATHLTVSVQRRGQLLHKEIRIS
jgi:general secretion pathway protein C